MEILIGVGVLVTIISFACKGDKVQRPTQSGTGTYGRQLLGTLPKLKGPQA